ncbi:hypothetical protein [Jeongeupia naejangsanensis]|uniref:Uncharacterized protein n=1 Tax=Jeongeupia naejangsanensis TaxID=613195 RepID=A0ABS2BQH3_9NEIS|nr:hypothetical protein [Jeongeupia naejangsanensis]MBM3117886.1 hypothetical protein [Jeongeupia naejangsanensis]
MNLPHLTASRGPGLTMANPATRFGSLVLTAGTRRPSTFFASVHRYRCVQFMADLRESFGCINALISAENPLEAMASNTRNSGYMIKKKCSNNGITWRHPKLTGAFSDRFDTRLTAQEARPDWAVNEMHSRRITHRTTLAGAAVSAQNNRVAFSSATGIGLPNIKADNRRNLGGFFTSVYRYRYVQFMAGRSGGVLARAGFLDAGRPTLLLACLLRLVSNGRLQIIKEPCPMASSALRAFTTHAFTALTAILVYAHSPALALLAFAAGLICFGIAHRGGAHD